MVHGGRLAHDHRRLGAGLPVLETAVVVLDVLEPDANRLATGEIGRVEWGLLRVDQPGFRRLRIRGLDGLSHDRDDNTGNELRRR